MSEPSPSRRLPRALRPFRVGQYRLLTGALTLSLLGSGMWIVAIVFQVMALDGTPTDLSFVATASALGLLGAILIGGVVADRVPQRSILIAVELARLVAVSTAAVLALSGALEIWQLAAISLLLGIADGFFYPAYSALLPSILPADQLLAANGVEGMLRPSIQQVIGPILASSLVAAFSPGWAFAVIAVLQVLGLLWLFVLRPTPVRREQEERQHPLRALASDVRGGFVYMVHTPWFFGTLVFGCAITLIIMGPIEVLLPFAVRDQTGGGPAEFAIVLAAFGVGGAVGSLVVASLTLPRRYLTIMVMLWGVGCLPLAIIGFTGQLWLMIIALFVCGVAFSAASVIWGTLLQRRVPPALLGRVSSLDFFISLALMPLSMAVAGPVGEAVGHAPTFLVAGVVPVFLALATVIIARLPADELRHPLDAAREAEPTGA